METDYIDSRGTIKDDHRVYFEPDRLREAIEKRGIRPGEMSIEMGHSRTYFNTALRKMKRISVQDVERIRKTYGISPDEYIVPAGQTEKVPVETPMEREARLEAERETRKKKLCKTCRWSSGSSTGVTTTCDYYITTGLHRKKSATTCSGYEKATKTK